jgi:uncharacterized protein YqgQ
MNIVYLIINRKLRRYDPKYLVSYGKLSYFVESNITDEEEANEINTTFLKSGLNKNFFMNKNWIISRQKIIRKQKEK